MDHVRGNSDVENRLDTRFDLPRNTCQLNNGAGDSQSCQTGFWCRNITSGSLLSTSAVHMMCILTSYLLQLCASSRHTCLFKKSSASILTQAGQSMYSRE